MQQLVETREWMDPNDHVWLVMPYSNTPRKHQHYFYPGKK